MTTRVEGVALAALQDGGLGEVERLPLGPVGALVTLRHGAGQFVEGGGDLVGHVAAVRDGERGLDHVAVLQTTQRCGRLGVDCRHRAVPRGHPLAVRLIAGPTRSPTYGDQERRGARVVAWQRTLERVERHLLRPIQPERTGRVAESSLVSFVDVGHRAEQAGLGLEQCGADGQVGRQRQGGVVLLRGEPRPEVQPEATVVGAADLLFGEFHAGSAASDLGGLDSTGEFVESVGQIVGRHGAVRELGPATDERSFDAVERGGAVGCHPHREHHRGSVDVGQQARRALGQHRRVQGGAPIGQIHRDRAFECLAVEWIAGLDEPADIGDRVVKDDVVAGGFERERLVEIDRRRRVERHEFDVGPIGVIGTGRPLRSRLRGGLDLGREPLGNLVLLADAVQSGPHRGSDVIAHLHDEDSRATKQRTLQGELRSPSLSDARDVSTSTLAVTQDAPAAWRLRRAGPDRASARHSPPTVPTHRDAMPPPTNHPHPSPATEPTPSRREATDEESAGPLSRDRGRRVQGRRTPSRPRRDAIRPPTRNQMSALSGDRIVRVHGRRAPSWLRPTSGRCQRSNRAMPTQ